MRNATARLHQLHLSAAGASLLPSCGNSLDGTVTPVDGQARLTFAQFAQLSTIGGSVVVGVSGYSPIIVFRTSDGEAAALSATCTHVGCILRARGASEIHCDCHNADFGLDGNVLHGPPPVPLPTYAATVDAEGISVQIT
jgi:nitrite reductase/ring-hydroxylating ferredoxin subunit